MLIRPGRSPWRAPGASGSRFTPIGRSINNFGTSSWSERYGWVSDRFGVSWQLVLDADAKQLVLPSLLFVGERCGHAEQAMHFYASVFRDAEVGEIARYRADQAPDREGTVMYGDLQLEGRRFAVMDSAGDHAFDFAEGVSLIVDTETQEQIDHYWSRLSAVPEAEQCGWLKDRYGVSWQIYPVAEMNRALSLADRDAANHAMEAILAMKKIDLAGLRSAVRGR